MAFQLNSMNNNNKNDTWVLNNTCKRGRMDEDDEDIQASYHVAPTPIEEGIKRLQNQQQYQKNIEMNLNMSEQQTNLPSITFASADYRPPPRQDALWLQAPTTTPANTTMNHHNSMDEDLTDEDDIPSVLTPSTSLQHPAKSQPNHNNSPIINTVGYGVATHPM